MDVLYKLFRGKLFCFYLILSDPIKYRRYNLILGFQLRLNLKMPFNYIFLSDWIIGLK